MRLLILLALLALVVWMVWTLVRTARLRAQETGAAEEPYQVLESVGDGHALVEIGRPAAGESVLIGSVALDDDDFDERYSRLVVQAEDRAATLNASRSLRFPP